MKKAEQLNDKFSKLFESGDDFIYISFGSMAPSYISYFRIVMNLNVLKDAKQNQDCIP